MSLVTDSPIKSSSSSDDFVAFLDEELESKSSDSSPCEEEDLEDGNEVEFRRTKRCKVENLEIVEEPQASTSHNSVFQASDTSSKQDICSHPGTFGDMCIVCGKRLVEESRVPFGYIHKELKLGNDEIVRLRNTDIKSLVRQRKLCLILDLDHTLLNTTLLGHMTEEEEYLKSRADFMQDRIDVSKSSLFMLNFMRMVTKLRPFVRTFLKEANKMFEMYIYTMGDKPYALEMAKLLDPRNEYFSFKVISRDDGTTRHQKGLDVVLGQESTVLILDDTEHVWPKHNDNLILMERYHFFSSSCRQFGFNCKSLSELKSDEGEADGALASVLEVLKKVHSMFFKEPCDNLAERDVRQVLKMVRKEVLQGCKIVFSRVFPTKFRAEDHQLWKIAENLGATCTTETDQSVTHVVSTDAGTDKSRWAVKENKFMVHPQWLEAANYFWQRLPEERFPVKNIKNQ